MKTISEITSTLGGAEVVSGFTGLSKSTVYKWPGSSIPDMHWPALIALAKSRKVKLTADDLLEANEQARAKQREKEATT